MKTLEIASDFQRFHSEYYGGLKAKRPENWDARSGGAKTGPAHGETHGRGDRAHPHAKLQSPARD